MKLRLSPLVLSLAALLSLPAAALNIVIDYSYDTNRFFLDNPTATAALEKAATDLGNLITTSLSPITSNVVNGSYKKSRGDFTFHYRLSHPSSSYQLTLTDTTRAADTIVIYPGSRSFSGSTLGQGGPVGYVYYQNAGPYYPSEAQGLITNIAENAELTYGRGGGVITYQSSDEFLDVPYTFNFGSVGGSISFNRNTNWHYDAHSPVPSGKSDLYSVALHEIMHVLGIGSSFSWDELANGFNWLGTYAPAVIGRSNNIINNSHVNGNVMGTNLQGQYQQAAMTPSIAIGTRKGITDVDLAFLQDLGWEITIPTDPYQNWTYNHGIANHAPNTDSDGDGVPNGIEFVIGGNPVNADSNHLLPTTSVESGHLVFTFRRSQDSISYNPHVKYSSDLEHWTKAEHGTNGISITTDNGYYGSTTDRVTARIPTSLATSGRIFARLEIAIPD